MQQRLGLPVARSGEVFKVVSDRGAGGHDLFSCMVFEDRFVRIYLQDGSPITVHDSLCFIDISDARRYCRLWKMKHPTWSLSIWKGIASRFVEVPMVCGDLSSVSVEKVEAFWQDPSSPHPLFRSPTPRSTVLCENLSLISPME